MLETKCSYLVSEILWCSGSATKKTGYPTLTVGRVREMWENFKLFVFLCHGNKQRHIFFQKRKSAAAQLRQGMYSLFHRWCPGQHRPGAVWVTLQTPALHRWVLMELLLHGNQTPLICLSSSSRVQKPPSPMETGAGSNKTSHGISKAIRGNLTAFMIQVLVVSAMHT